MHDDTMSERDEIIGVAMSAGSTPIFFASIGSIPPSSLAKRTTRIIESATVAPISTD